MIPVNSILLHDKSTRRWLFFESPLKVYEVHDKSLLPATLAEIDYVVNTNKLYAAGFLSYEAAEGINPLLTTQSASGFPLCWFGLYTAPRVIDAPGHGLVIAPLDWQSSVSLDQYHAALRQIQQNIRDGETYQVNYSYRLRATMSADPWQLFVNMVAAQGHGYSACVELADWSICSASPELFFALDGQQLICRPMKGTISRGLTFAADTQLRNDLYQSVKDRAENLMILDMVRNDLGKIADTGSVSTDSFFDIEKYPTVWQMTSTVHCRSRAGLGDLLQALYPAASITGAPKRHTMDIISELECSPRNIYTGTIGYYAPERRSQFNVAIRTVLVDKRRQQAEYGIGGGIVWDSQVASEFTETRSKAAVLDFYQSEFSLLETLRWSPEQGYWLLHYHLQRLRESAEYFSRVYDQPGLIDRLEQLAREFELVPYRVRVLLDQSGKFTFAAVPVRPYTGPARITMAEHCVDSSDVFLYHKTTNRKIYTDAIASADGYDDVLLWNEKGEITETCIANIVVELQGQYYTPPVSCGLLAGTYRAELLQQGRISERVIKQEELNDCSAFYLINSVRGWWQAELVF